MRKRLLLLLSVLLSFSLIAAACGDDEETDAGSTDSASESESTSDAAEEDDATEEVAAAETTVGLVYDIGGRGDLSFNDSAAAGLDRAEAELGIAYGEASPNDDGSNRAELLQLAADANPIVIGVGFLFAGDAAAVAAENPDTNFAVIDDAMLNFETDPPSPVGSNVAGLVFAEEQGREERGRALRRVLEPDLPHSHRRLAAHGRVVIPEQLRYLRRPRAEGSRLHRKSRPDGGAQHASEPTLREHA